MKHFVCVLAVGVWFAVILPCSAQENRPLGPTDPKGEIMCLEVSRAVDVAPILKEAFNGSGPGRVTVFAIPMTNCLYVKATRADLLAIRRLLGPM
jgi:hypothetical protein